MSFRKLAVIVFALLMLGCDERASPGKESSTKPEAKALSREEITAFIEKRCEKNGRAIFVSRDGEYAGMDSDSLLSFEKGGEAVMGEYGVGYQGYGGTYHVTSHGKVGFVELKLKGYPGVWPLMAILSDGEDHWLHVLSVYKPVDVMMMGGRGGFIDSGDLKPFWPFRLVGDSNKPKLSPVFTRAHLTYFESPVLPPDFRWKEDELGVFFDVKVLADGKVKVLNHSVFEEYELAEEDIIGNHVDGLTASRSRPVSESDWRWQSVQAIENAMQKWVFEPSRENGKAVTSVEQSWYIRAYEVDGSVHWVIDDIYDNMPRRSRQMQGTDEMLNKLLDEFERASQQTADSE